MQDRKNIPYNCILDIKSTKYKFHQIKYLEPNTQTFNHAFIQKQINKRLKESILKSHFL